MAKGSRSKSEDRDSKVIAPDGRVFDNLNFSEAQHLFDAAGPGCKLFLKGLLIAWGDTAAMRMSRGIEKEAAREPGAYAAQAEKGGGSKSTAGKPRSNE